ncbi:MULTISPECIES: hypothetical protein [unclassified Streptomyces]|uniref:hypothetical protein n=1 Tax=unclassified Streptomyces TaxID=2593676 RepID=UPI002DD9AB48|nr:hypothetical protein [Streptomyces sp. NBC_01795]WSA93516.1 hypothetical protein OIE63_19480 [Streptomyces sp. NBC_01795]WSS42682.1 hypothetical protein OG220_20415 [Streptomyces sp. NBC_01187]
MKHVLADPQGLSARARRFLGAHASMAPFDATAGPSDDELRGQLRALFDMTDDTALTRLRGAQARYGGLRYHSAAWGFREVIEFAPWPEYEAGDGEPIAWFIEHGVAYPWAVWMLGDGTVAYCFPGPHVGQVVPVFRSGDAVIERDALYHECADWTPVRPPGSHTPLTARAVRTAAQRQGLAPLHAASGHTEWWWEGDGFRVHVSFTFAKVFEEPEEERWWIWADGPSAEHAARAFLAGATEE